MRKKEQQKMTDKTKNEFDLSENDLAKMKAAGVSEDSLKSPQKIERVERNTPKKAKRSRESSDVSFESSNFLKIPQNVKDEFLSLSYGLRWGRILINGEQDNKNIAKLKNQGWVFVYKDELPDDYANQFEEMDLQGADLDGLVVYRDVALMKNSMANIERYRSRVAERANMRGYENKIRETGYVSDDKTTRGPLKSTSFNQLN